MKKKRIILLFLAMILALAIAGCNDKNEVDKEDTEVSGDVSENESVLENETVTGSENVTEETQKTDNKKDNTTTNTETNKNNTTTNKNESTSNKNETTGNNNTTTKPSTGSTGNSGSTGNTQNNNSGTTTKPSTPVHEHKWTEVRGIVVVQEAWVEDVFGWRTICGKCGLDMTNMTDEELTIHCSCVCNSRYSAKYIKYDEINHPAVTEEQVTGYKCECGAEK